MRQVEVGEPKKKKETFSENGLEPWVFQMRKLTKLSIRGSCGSKDRMTLPVVCLRVDFGGFVLFGRVVLVR